MLRTPLSVDRRLGCFQPLPVIRKAAVDIPEPVFVWIHTLISHGNE